MNLQEVLNRNKKVIVVTCFCKESSTPFIYNQMLDIFRLNVLNIKNWLKPELNNTVNDFSLYQDLKEKFKSHENKKN